MLYVLGAGFYLFVFFRFISFVPHLFWLKMGDVVKLGDYVIIQRQNYTKLHKMTAKNKLSLGKDQIEIEGILGQPYWSSYRMESIGTKSRCYTLVKCRSTSSLTNEIIRECGSGLDNREIIDDGSSQKLSTDDIVNLRNSGMSAQGIVSHLVENSKTFLNKTEYSQEKYLRKKEKKYFEYLTIHKPNFRQVAEILLRNAFGKMLGLRMDTLAQLTTMACVRPGGTYMVYESGCQGLVAAALLNCIGTTGTIVHVHPGHAPPKHAVLSMNWTQQQLSCLLSINIQTLLKGVKYYEDDSSTGTNSGSVNKTSQVVGDDVKSTVQDNGLELIQEGQSMTEPGMEVDKQWESDRAGNKRKAETVIGEAPAKRARWKEEANRAIDTVKNHGVDGLVIVGREHPAQIFTALLPYLSVSRPFVVFCSVREPLQELYCLAKARPDVICLRLTESWLRSYQVLPDRTHPDISMSGCGGFLLSGTTVLS